MFAGGFINKNWCATELLLANANKCVKVKKLVLLPWFSTEFKMFKLA